MRHVQNRKLIPFASQKDNYECIIYSSIENIFIKYLFESGGLKAELSLNTTNINA